MSRRKQSKPRQIKRSIGDLDTGDENPPDDLSLSGDEGGASDLEDSAELDGCSPPSLTPLATEGPRTQDGLLGPEEEEEEEEEEEDRGPTHSAEEEEDMEMEMEMEAEGDGESHWMGPDELELSEDADGFKVLAARDLPADTLWGPYPGAVQSEESSDAVSTNEVPILTLMCLDVHCWLSKVPVALEPSEANCSIYSQGEELYCKMTREVCLGGSLVASLSCPPLLKTVATQSQGAPVKEEPASPYPAALHSEIQLLPQQAGMAAILATAVVNKDIFPCKDCGIWYRSERNLHAHLMYYCASRQKVPSQEASASPPQDSKGGSKESYPNERVCPFPQCQKSCPSASSLEIHMRTHSGERPFMCLICLSAFTTKANCERHLKVHTDTLSGVCHGCGFVSTTRDILYSHLVTSHMACQPGGRPEVYSPGPGAAKLPIAAGLSPGDSGIVLKCQVCGAAADTPALLQQHVRTHLEERMHSEHSPTPRQAANHSNTTTTNITSTSSTTSSSSSSSSTHHHHHHHHHHLQDRELATGMPRPNSSSPGTNGDSATPCGGCSPPDGVVGVRVKEEPQSDVEHDAAGSERDAGEDDRVGGGGGGGAGVGTAQHHHHGDHHRGSSSGGGGDSSSSQKSTSPKSPAGGVAAVKAEPTSPTPGCSPAHSSPGGSTLPGGAVFLPQYVFGSEASAAMMPQASEILAKMSEMVHSRLKQGHGQLAATAAAAAAVAAAAAAAQAQQGGFFPAGSPTATTAGPPPTAQVHKGATCFECDITFNNINNFYVHKRLYCSSRHHQGEREQQPKDGTSNPPSASASALASASAAAASPISGSGGASGGSRAASASPNDTESATVGGGAEVKSEPRSGGSREPGCSSSSEGEGCGGARSVGGRASEGSQSPGSGVGSGAGSGAGATTSATGAAAGVPGSVTPDDDIGEDDPTRTFCVACNIRFSRHDNYLVHKRFYCASRHDPTQQRVPPAAKTNAFMPQPIRTRKRKKMYEIHMARTQALAAGAQAMAQAQAAAAGMHSIKQEVTSAGTFSANASSGGTAAVVAMAMPAKSRSTSPEGEGPIDLSKRPRVRGASRGGAGAVTGTGSGGGGGGLPVLPLSDYHKCTACSISFNSIENYLAHKTYYCPATTLQPHTLEQLQRLKRPASTSPKSLHSHPHPHPQEGPLPPKVAAMGKASLGAAVPGTPLPSHPGSSEVACVTPLHAAAHSAKQGPPVVTPGFPVLHPPAGGAPVVCPYCPPGRALTTDLVEHLRVTHGLVLSMQQGEGGVMTTTTTTAAVASAASATGAPPVSPSSSVSPRDTTGATSMSPRPSPRSRRDSINGGPRSRDPPGSPHSPLVNGSPGGASTSGHSSGGISPKSAPQALSPPAGALQLTVSSPSPVDTHLRDAPLTPPEKPLPLGAVLTPVAVAKAVAASGAVAGVGPMGASTPNVAASMQNGNTRYCRLCNIKFSSLSTFIAHKKYYCSSHSAEHVK
ncbi:zinc finger protein ZFPM1 [Engraulis encrasicolus]|uniref:zinc finger protein ZFPM1 n=1 Tax=Engraulis encrasicolus TaxID=184585 RepID=UPI002FD25A72